MLFLVNDNVTDVLCQFILILDNNQILILRYHGLTDTVNLYFVQLKLVITNHILIQLIQYVDVYLYFTDINNTFRSQDLTYETLVENLNCLSHVHDLVHGLDVESSSIQKSNRHQSSFEYLGYAIKCTQGVLLKRQRYTKKILGFSLYKSAAVSNIIHFLKIFMYSKLGTLI